MTVKKTITILLLAVGLGFLCYFGIKTIQKISKSAAEQTATLPDFAIKNNGGVIFSKQSLQQNTPSVFIAFHPECENCQYEAKSINAEQKALVNTNIVMFTSANDSLIHAFSKAYGLDSLKNIHILNDSTNTMWQF
jgi:peroxiredoxin